jgi:hypothetical protein
MQGRRFSRYILDRVEAFLPVVRHGALLGAAVPVFLFQALKILAQLVEFAFCFRLGDFLPGLIGRAALGSLFLLGFPFKKRVFREFLFYTGLQIQQGHLQDLHGLDQLRRLQKTLLQARTLV